MNQCSKVPEVIYVCRDCYFTHDSMYDIDKCPYCKSDDWAEFYEAEDE